jgi:hypothetical protein
VLQFTAKKRVLHLAAFGAYWACMTAKKMALETLEQLPDNVTFDEIAEHLETLAVLRKGLDSLDRGASKSIDEVEKLLASWTTK